MEGADRDLRDGLGRPLRDLRLSVTDRCNLRCGYCMPRHAFGPGRRFLPHRELLTPEELMRLATAFLPLGVRKVRLTGGEPLLRAELCDIVGGLSALGVDLALTTNGVLLRRLAARLWDSGLRRINVSLDTLDPETFGRISDVRVPLAEVLAGVAAAREVGFSPIKLNCVLRRGVNDHEVDAMVDHAREYGHVLRFIEYMDVGSSNGWRRDEMVPAAELLQRIGARHPLEPVAADEQDGVARRHRFVDGGGEIGLIASVSEPFCGGCTRARVSADGRLYTCLFAHGGTDLAQLVRDSSSSERLTEAIAAVWTRRSDRYSELRGLSGDTPGRVEMSYLGG